MIEKRRYAVFASIFGEYTIVVKGEYDIKFAPKWGGFVKWIGPVRIGYGSKYKTIN
jgi:hypothetical protein